jgi:hypothetical protein
VTLTRHGAYLLVGPAAILIWTAVFVALRSGGVAPGGAPTARRRKPRRVTAVCSTLALVVIALVQPVLPAWATPFNSVRNNGGSSFDAYAWKSYQTTVSNDPAAAHWWRLAEASGNNLAGKMLGAVNGNYVNGHGTQSYSPTILTSRLTAATFNGSNQCVNLTNIFDNPGTTAFSVELWFNQDTRINGRTMRLLTGLTGQDKGWELSINAPDHATPSSRNTIYFARGSGVGAVDYAGTGAVNLDQWYHLVATYGSNQMAVYLDGVLMGTPTSSTRSLPAGTSDPLMLGCRLVNPGDANTHAEWFQGAIAEVSLYTRALTAREVRSHYYASAANGAP